MKVEKAGTADIDALVQMRLDYLREDNGCLSEQEEETIRSGLPAYYRTSLGKELSVYVIRDGQAIVSCAFLLTVNKPMSPAFLNGKTGTLLNVYTVPEYRRRGYSRAILTVLLSDAKEMELSVIELKATEDGYPLYKSLGFQDDGMRYHNMKWKNAEICG